MREIDAAEDEPTVLIKHRVTRDITTPPILERQVGPAVVDDGSLSGSDAATPAPPRAGVGWQLAASVVVAALLTAAVLVLR